MFYKHVYVCVRSCLLRCVVYPGRRKGILSLPAGGCDDHLNAVGRDVRGGEVGGREGAKGKEKRCRKSEVKGETKGGSTRGKKCRERDEGRKKRLWVGQ